jgi:ribosomal protein L11 methyltransferase
VPDPSGASGSAAGPATGERRVAPWHAVRVRATGEARELATAALFAAGSQGVLEEADAILTHFPPEADVAQVRAAVLDAAPGVDVELGKTDGTDWAEAWKTRVRMHELGSLVVAPPWLADGRDPARTIVIDPGMAFGTGEHATTRGVVRLMQQVIRPGDLVADLGAGSAILAIAAAKLGAARVAAIELDAEAIPDAEENVRVNGVADRVTVLQGDAMLLLPLVAPVRVVLANIISSVLVELMPHVARGLATDGVAILSGILQEERDHMLSVLETGGWRVVAEDAEDIWWSATAVRA